MKYKGSLLDVVSFPKKVHTIWWDTLNEASSMYDNKKDWKKHSAYTHYWASRKTAKKYGPLLSKLMHDANEHMVFLNERNDPAWMRKSKYERDIVMEDMRVDKLINRIAHKDLKEGTVTDISKLSEMYQYDKPGWEITNTNPYKYE